MSKECCNKKTSIGGQALMEGIMMRGPYLTAMAVRRANGEIEVETSKNPKRSAWLKIPVIRGPISFVQSMSVGTKALMRSAEISMEDEIEKAETEEEETPDLEAMSARQRAKYEKKQAKREKEKEKEARKKEKNEAKIAELKEKFAAEKAEREEKFAAAEAKIAAKEHRSSGRKTGAAKEKFDAACKKSADARRAKFDRGEKALLKAHREEVAAWRRGEGGFFMNLLITCSTLLGFALAILLFFFLPTWAYTGIMALLPENIVEYFSSTPVWQSVFEGILRLVIFVIYIKLCTLMKETRRLFAYHGAEHKTIFCYEAGKELTVENVRKFKRFHPRCGTSFLIIMMVIGIIVGIFIPRTIPYAFITRPLIKLLLIPVTMGVGYELLKLCGRFDNFLTRIIAAPGMWMQRLTTCEPEDDQIECAIKALEAVIPDDGSDQW